MKMKLLLVCVLASLNLTGVVSAQDGSIGVYLDAAGSLCDGNAVPGSPLNGSVWVNLAGGTSAGITGTEFRIDALDRTGDYVYVATVNPAANVNLGDPFNTQGVNVAFPSCQSGVSTGGRVQLFTFTVLSLNSNASQNNWLTLRQKFMPSNEFFACPLVTLCDAPIFTKVCMGAQDSDHWRAVINPQVGVTGDCQPVAVESQTWTGVKGLYRN